MSVPTFLILLGVGAALIAFWLVLRFPERGPGDLRRALLHVCVALLIGWLAPSLVGALVAHGKPFAVAAIFAIVLPVLVYMFVASAWFLKLTHDMFARYR
jgi:hypothetical protein